MDTETRRRRNEQRKRTRSLLGIVQRQRREMVEESRQTRRAGVIQAYRRAEGDGASTTWVQPDLTTVNGCKR